MGERNQDTIAAAESDDLRFEDYLLIWPLRAFRWALGKLPPWAPIVLFGWFIISMATIGSGEMSAPPSWPVMMLIAPAVPACLFVVLGITQICVKVLMWPLRMLWDWVR